MPEARVGKLVLGTAALGLPYGLPRADGPVALPAAEDARAVIEEALICGITRFDTAPAYGQAEERLGAALHGAGEVWTKVARPGEAVDWGDAVVASAEASCARLGRDRLDCVQWHNWTGGLATDARFRQAWERLRASGRVSVLGASTYGVADACAAIESGYFGVVQVEWNLLSQDVVDRAADAAGRAGVRLAARSVLLQGALTDEGRVVPPALVPAVAAARAVAARAGVGLTRLALGAALDDPRLAHVLVGFDRPAQLHEALAIARGASLPVELRAALASLDLEGDSAADPRTWR